MQTLRLIDSNGTVVPTGIRYCVPDSEVAQVTDHLMKVIAPEHAAHWPTNQLCDYRVAPD
jgi:hypothetical protein